MLSPSHAAPAGLTPPRGKTFLNRLLRDIRVWYVARQTRMALSQLSARQLHDLGLTPADIDAVARKVARQ